MGVGIPVKIKNLALLFLLIPSCSRIGFAIDQGYTNFKSSITVHGVVTIPNLPNQPCLGTDGSGNVENGTCGGGGGATALTVQSNGTQATSTTTIINFVSPLRVSSTTSNNARVSIDTTSSTGLLPISVASSTYFQPANATTSNLPEGSNLYFTTARSTSSISNSAPITYANGIIGIDKSSATLLGPSPTTSIISEGSRLYFTTARATSSISAVSPITYSNGVIGADNSVLSTTTAAALYVTKSSASQTYFQPANATTSNLPEGTNQYFTTARATSAISATAPITSSNGVIGTDGSLLSTTTAAGIYLDKSSATQTYFQPSNATTSNLPEGSNLYFTTARTTSAVSAALPLTYSNGIFSAPSSTFTLYGPNIPASAISAGSLGPNVLVSSLAATGVIPGTYGSATQVSSVTIRGDGRVSSATNVTISLTNANLQSGTYSNVTVPAANVAAGALGSSVLVSSLTQVVGGGSCTNCSATINPQGQVTAFSNGSAGSGNGTVNAGTIGQNAYYAVNGATVSGSSNMITNTSSQTFNVTTNHLFGVGASTVNINNANALGILSGSNRARFRMAGIMSLQNISTDSPDSTGVFMAAGSNGTTPIFMTARRAAGTDSSPTATTAGMNLLQISAGGFGTNFSTSSTGRMDFISEEIFSDSSQATAWKLSTTPSGSTTTVQRVYVAGSGAVTAASSWTFQSNVGLSSLINTASLATDSTGKIIAGSASGSSASGPGGSVQISSGGALSNVASFYYSTATGSLYISSAVIGGTTLYYDSANQRFSISTNTIINGVLTTVSQMNGMSITDRGLTVNNGQYSTVGSSSPFIVKNAFGNEFTVDPVNNIVVSSVAMQVQGNVSFIASTQGVAGTLTSGLAGAGNVGEFFSSATASATNLPATTQYGDLVSTQVTAGAWLVTFMACEQQNGATLTSGAFIGISTTTGNSSAGLIEGVNQLQMGLAATTGDACQTISSYPMNFSVSTIIYGKMEDVYSLGQPRMVGSIFVTRIH